MGSTRIELATKRLKVPYSTTELRSRWSIIVLTGASKHFYGNVLLVFYYHYPPLQTIVWVRGE